MDISIKFIWKRPTWSIRWSTRSSLWWSFSTSSSTGLFVIGIKHPAGDTSTRRCFNIWVSIVMGSIYHYKTDSDCPNHQTNWVISNSPDNQVKRNITGTTSAVLVPSCESITGGPTEKVSASKPFPVKSLCPSTAWRGFEYDWWGCRSRVPLLTWLKGQHGDPDQTVLGHHPR